MDEFLQITKARHLAEYRLAVEFSDGTRQELDFAAVVQQFPPHDHRAIYQQPAAFREFAVEGSKLVWGEDWDLVFPLWRLHRNQLQ